MSMFKSLLLPHFDYGDILYMHTSESNLDRLQVIQNSACRVILMANKYTSTEFMHQELGIARLKDRRLFHVSLFMFKVQNGLITSTILKLKFVSIDSYHGRATRAYTNGNLAVPAHNNKYGLHAISNFGARVWNLIPNELRNVRTAASFTAGYWRWRVI